ncbi:Peptidoglycan/xylan/chitin deacetylase, PgdA/CDA1 family [Actinokineospora alba]|uniref:Peptidoglycan/xylan/chitin deacetylase, PgdA/CDA1 family n=1 Tax=Actinokineospora alba TaxID=504798 RepID=A0A1H0PFL1_9PSEU|nr:polysaccharide deacetylase family protein [Actinokineospora alba]TDP65778.1 peptidoglycan/xylan/chitin deacetylase (PgdA/CDA1 family) [Actinokineospora alba]SDI65323.1 Peptidoglycan/xylan/chitin deacetylase, PgdA/CDA1 family [Actinokineospora alba]SDP03847.1 Peptidoglycan/xylan/chitin deacetylase, PgdA/CDA1 family [Actinokineospora alba]
MTSLGALTSGLAQRLSPRARTKVRQATDRLLTPIGSLRAARTSERMVALTYDDGPDPDGTPEVLEALAALGIHATFFILVERAERHPDLVRRVVAEGHEIALHGIDHARLTGLPASQVHRLIADGKRRLAAVSGTDIRLFRPAYGSQSLSTFAAARRAGLEVVVWGPTVSDWVDGSAREVARRALPQLHPGAIVLLHDGFEVPEGDDTPRPTFDRGEVTRELVAALGEQGYRAGSVAEVLTTGKPWRTAWFRP